MVSDFRLEQRIEEIVIPLARALEVDLVEVSCLGKGSGACIRVTIDKEDGVGIGDCEQLHHSLSRTLDVLDPIPHSYRLEVSSPGLDRPLKHRKDYQRSVQKLIRVKLLNPFQGKSSLVGHLQKVSDEGIDLLPTQSIKGKREQIALTWAMIAKAKLEVEF